MDIGTTIKERRKKARLTQQTLADSCSITQTYLSQIENNQREPNLSTLKAISKELDLPLPVLFFMSLDTEDIKLEKKEAFKILSPSIKAFINEFFEI